MMQEFGQHHVAQTAQNDEGHHRGHNHRAVPQAHEIVLVDGEAGIAKGGNGVEEGGKQGVQSRGLAPQEGQENQEDSRHFDAGRDEQYLQKFLLEFDAQVPLEEGIVQGGLGGQGEPPAQHEVGHGRKGHDAQAADLDEADDHHLAEGRIGGAGVHDDEAGDADRRGGGEQGVHPAHLTPGLGPGQQEKQGPHQNDPGETADQQGLGHLAIRPQASEKFTRHGDIYAMRGVSDP